MKDLWQRLLEDETGVILSSELALVGTVGVLGMVVGLEAVSCSVTSELNDLSSAFGALNQTYNYRSISKAGHARASGSGFNDNGDACDCQLITQTDVGGQSGAGFSQGGGFSQSFGGQNALVSPAPVVREQVIEERVVDEVLVEPTIVKAVVQDCPDDEIIEEHIIRRRVRSDCDKSIKVDCDKTIKPDVDTTTKPIPKPNANKSKASPKPAPSRVEK